MPQDYQHPADNRGEHPIDIVPPPSSPLVIDVDHPAYGDDVTFWKPTFADTMKHLGWRWIMFLPALAIIAAFVSMVWFYRYSSFLFIGGGKLLMLSIGLAITTAGTALKSAVKERKNPFCIHCGYDLTGLSKQINPICPECGMPYSLQLIDEYRRDPHWFIQRYKARKKPLNAPMPFMAGPVRRKKSRDGT